MLKNELLRRVGSYNNRLVGISFSISDTGAIMSKINALEKSWDTNSSSDIIKQLKNECRNLETKIDELRSDVDSIKNSSLSFTFENHESGRKTNIS